MCLICVWIVFLSIIGTESASPVSSVTDTNRTSIFWPNETRAITASNVASSLLSNTRWSAIHNTTFLPSSISVSSTLNIRAHSTSTVTSTRASPTVKNLPQNKTGFCAKYTELPCQNILRESLIQFNETDRYFDAKHGVNGSKYFLTLLLRETGKLTDPRCKWLIEVAMCQYTLPPCMKNGRYISFCREDCESLNQECKASLNRLIGTAGILKEIKKLDFNHLALPTNCSIFSSGKSAGNNSCVFLGVFDHSSKPTTSLLSGAILWIVIGAGAFVLVIISSIVTACCIKQRRKKRNEREAFEAMALQQLNRPAECETTMKARVSQLLEAHLSSKIAELYDPSKLRQFSLDQIEYVSDLGEGQFGLVFKGVAVGIDECKDATEKTNVAVKTLKADCNEDSKEEFDQEVALMSVVDHPNVVKLMAVATEEQPYCMIFEFMEFGDLNQFLRKIKPLDGTDDAPELELCVEDFLSICSQVASGMSHLASLHFVHRDLATRNCLVGTGLVVKIADFGLARDIYSSDYYKVRGDAMLPVRWMPPEAVLHGRFTVESDVYSYGVLMWEVFTYALQPYYGYTNEEVIAFAKQGVLLGKPEESPDHIYKLMLDCWTRTPEKRPNFTSIIKRLVKDPPVSEYCTPRTLSITAEEPIETLSSTSEEPIRRSTAKTEEPIRKSTVTASSEAKNQYLSPGAIVNSGFKTHDNAECSEKETLQIVGNYDIVYTDRYSNCQGTKENS